MQKIDSQLRALALEEVYSLRGQITDSERSNLNFWALRPGDASKCLMGQICGATKGDRYCRLLSVAIVPFTGYGELSKKFGIDNGPNLAVEIYMRQPWAENKKIIHFLRGEIQDLTVDDL